MEGGPPEWIGVTGMMMKHLKTGPEFMSPALFSPEDFVQISIDQICSHKSQVYIDVLVLNVLLFL